MSRLTLATFLDHLLARRGAQVISYQDDFIGLDGRPQPVQRFGDLHREVAAFSGFLREDIGLRPGELVAIYKTNDYRFFRWFLAVIRAGGIAVPLNRLLTLAELQRILAHCGARVLVTDRAAFHGTIGVKNALPVRDWIQADSEPGLLEGFRRPSPEWLEKPLVEPAQLEPDDTVAIFHTSGTQGFPKGAMLSSRALLAGRAIATLFAPFLSKRDLALLCLPWAHIMAVSTALYGLMAGVPARFLERFDAEQAIAAIERHRITVFVGVPTMLVKLVNAAPPKEKLASVRLWVSASDYLPQACRVRLLEYGALFRVLGRRIMRPLVLNAYGMVELGGSAMFGLDAAFFPGQGELCLPVPPYRIRIAGSDGRVARRGQVGECLIKGPGLTGGYWKDPRSTAELLTADGWLRTGDLAVKTRLGLVRLVGRAKEVIKCGGYSVHTREVEEVLAAHPAVAAAAAVGVPHPEKGEVPIAFAELRPESAIGEQELLEWCRARLAPYKSPRRIHLVEPGELPQGVTEKVLKRVLRERIEGNSGGA
jgi:acyl-CoA synthetase (AMP-forming)/AMP-acid ligase II